jgi:hypothetical protein
MRKSGFVLMHTETRQLLANLTHTYHSASFRQLNMQSSYFSMLSILP